MGARRRRRLPGAVALPNLHAESRQALARPAAGGDAVFLTNSDLVELIELRHRLHRNPEISGEERATAAEIVAALAAGHGGVVKGMTAA